MSGTTCRSPAGVKAAAGQRGCAGGRRHRHRRLCCCSAAEQQSTASRPRVVLYDCYDQQIPYKQVSRATRLVLLAGALGRRRGTCRQGRALARSLCAVPRLDAVLRCCRAPVKAWRWQKDMVERVAARDGSVAAGSGTGDASGAAAHAPAAAAAPLPSPGALLLLQHPPVYTLGAGATEGHLRFDAAAPPLPLYRTERGGEVRGTAAPGGGQQQYRWLRLPVCCRCCSQPPQVQTCPAAENRTALPLLSRPTGDVPRPRAAGDVSNTGPARPAAAARPALVPAQPGGGGDAVRRTPGGVLRLLRLVPARPGGVEHVRLGLAGACGEVYVRTASPLAAA